MELQKIILERDLPNFVGLRRTQIQHKVKRGEFPAPVKLSARRKGWLASEIAAWQQQQIAKRDRKESSE